MQAFWHPVNLDVDDLEQSEIYYKHYNNNGTCLYTVNRKYMSTGIFYNGFAHSPVA